MFQSQPFSSESFKSQLLPIAPSSMCVALNTTWHVATGAFFHEKLETLRKIIMGWWNILTCHFLVFMKSQPKKLHFPLSREGENTVCNLVGSLLHLCRRYLFSSYDVPYSVSDTEDARVGKEGLIFVWHLQSVGAANQSNSYPNNVKLQFWRLNKIIYTDTSSALSKCELLF